MSVRLVATVSRQSAVQLLAPLSEQHKLHKISVRVGQASVIILESAPQATALIDEDQLVRVAPDREQCVAWVCHRPG